MDILSDIKFCSVGESALYVEVGNSVSQEINSRVVVLCKYLASCSGESILEYVPSYCGVTIIFDPFVINSGELRDGVIDALSSVDDTNVQKRQVIKIPVCYEGVYAPDIAEVAEVNSLSVTEVIDIHTSRDYLIYMLGFTPGFPYLGGMDSRIATSRRAEPRKRIEAGSVGIAGEQTGIYSVDSPGGWQIIGKTPSKLFDIGREKPFLFEVGQYIRFYPITSEEYCAVESR